MDEKHPGQAAEHEDSRASEPPDRRRGDAEPEQPAASESGGPQGNPDLDEEALGHAQQDEGG